MGQAIKVDNTFFTYHCADDNGVSTIWDFPHKANIGDTFKCEWGEYKVEELIRESEFHCERISKNSAFVGYS
jgi:hypothetical protein